MTTTRAAERVRTGGSAVVRLLADAGFDTAFGIPAQMNLAIYDGFLDEPRLRHVLTRHELGAAYMADGYARAAGRPAILSVVGGPGLTNALTGIAEARAASSPILVLTTTIAARYLGQDRSTTHELPDQAALIDSLLDWRRRVDEPGGLGPAVSGALERLALGRPRPIAIEITPDVLNAAAAAEPGDVVAAPRPSLDAAAQNAITAATELIAGARRPVIWAGGGVVAANAEAELAAIAEHLAAPVVTTDGSRGAIPDSHPLALGASWVRGDGVHRALTEADVIVAVGTTFSALATEDWRLELTAPIVRIDVDAAELSRTYPSAVGVVGDARLVLEALRERVPRAPEERRREVLAATAEAQRQVSAAARAEAIPRTLLGDGTVIDLLESIRAGLPADGILTVDSLIGYWVARHFPTERTRTVQLITAYGSLGFALPGAIGAKLARPEAPVVALVGDGAFMFTAQELGTAVQERLPVVTVIYNDGGYGSIRWNQRRRYGRTIAADLVQPHFVAFARSMGARALRVRATTDVGPAIAAALEEALPTVIEVPLGIEPPYMG